MGEREERMKVAIAGLGAMGAPMAAHIAAAGFPISGYDPSPAACEKAQAWGVTIVSDILDLAGADILLVMVQTDSQVEAVLEESGVIDRMKPGSVVCVATSTTPDTCERLAARAAVRSVGLLDTPVVLGQQAADEGRLTVLVGGKASHLERARPVLAAFGRQIVHVGGSGQGQVAKVVNNMLLWSTMCANFEALSLARSLGAEMDRLLPALAHCSCANWSLSRWGRSYPKWAEKDMDTVLDLAQEARLPLPLHGLVDQMVKTIDNARMRELLS